MVGARGTAALALMLSFAVACGREAGPPDGPRGEPTLAAIRGDIFATTCALGACHARPTPAAKLDLSDSGLCRLLVRNKSCLFGDKLLVVPGKPEASFLMDKLRGTGLDRSPDPACATTNERMPLGQPPLTGEQLAQVEAWIRQGADCGGDVPVDAGAEPPDAPADIAALTAASATIRVGERTELTVTLARPAPAAGQTIILEVEDVEVLAAPPTIRVEQGLGSAKFDVEGKKAGAATAVTASGGKTSKSVSITVTP